LQPFRIGAGAGITPRQPARAARSPTAGILILARRLLVACLKRFCGVVTVASEANRAAAVCYGVRGSTNRPDRHRRGPLAARPGGTAGGGDS
jgi:hypothetical protein